MEILFCELCNESVPQADLDAGRAYYRKGRLICASCDVAMGGGREVPGEATVVSEPPEAADPIVVRVGPAEPGAAAAPAAPRPRPARAETPGGAAPAPAAAPLGSGFVVGLLALGFAAAGFWAVLQRLDRMESDRRAERRELEAGLTAAERRHDLLVAGLPGQLSGVEQRVAESQAAARRELADAIEGLRTELVRFDEREEAVAKELGALRGELDQAERGSRERGEALKAQVVDLEKDLRFYSDRLIELEESLRILSTSGPVASGVLPPVGGAQGAGGTPAAPTAKAWQGLLADLGHTNAGIRLETVYALGETGDRDVIPHLVPMLEDVDLFVRMATARMLEELDARVAVPALIEALEDGQSAVREAAVVALRQITGKDFHFEPVATDAERAKKVKAWRDWWKKSGEDFLAES